MYVNVSKGYHYKTVVIFDHYFYRSNIDFVFDKCIHYVLCFAKHLINLMLLHPVDNMYLYLRNDNNRIWVLLKSWLFYIFDTKIHHNLSTFIEKKVYEVSKDDTQTVHAQQEDQQNTNNQCFYRCFSSQSHSKAFNMEQNFSPHSKFNINIII